MIELVQLAAAVASNAAVAAQLTGATRRPDVAGVSILGAALATVSCAAWTFYAAGTGLWVAAASSLCGVLLWAAIAAVVSVRGGRRHDLRTAIAASGTWGLLLGGAHVVGSYSALGMMLMLEAVTATAPQAWRAWRTSAAGVSAWTWAGLLGVSTLWACYAAAMGDTPLLVVSSVKGALCVCVLIAIWSAPHRAYHAPAHQGL
jgi:hypothetical protein